MMMNRELESFGANIESNDVEMVKPASRKKVARPEGAIAKGPHSMSQGLGKTERSGSHGKPVGFNSGVPRPPGFKRYTPFEPAKVDDGKIVEPSRVGPGSFKKMSAAR